MKRTTFLSGTGLVSLHPTDAAVVGVEPGAPLARHLPWPAATLAVAAAAALSSERLPCGTRAAAAGIFGARSTDKIRLDAWYVPGRDGAARCG
jgi:hypothetical protein